MVEDKKIEDLELNIENLKAILNLLDKEKQPSLYEASERMLHIALGDLAKSKIKKDFEKSGGQK